MARSRTIRVDGLARVEGEGALYLRMNGREVAEVRLQIYEPPRFFEAFLRGRSQLEVPDITSRICGICPVAYITSACNAIEAAHGIRIEPSHRDLRRLLYCGEWIESHSLHVFMLHLPDFLGYPDAISMAREHGDLFRSGLRLKKAGNAIVSLLGGREIHPINMRVGGFYRAPQPRDLASLRAELADCRELAHNVALRLGRLPFPAFERDYEFVALQHPSEYAITEGRIVSNHGLDVPVDAFEDHIVEEQVPYSTALHARLRDRGAYVCGPMARFNLNADRLPDAARALADAVGLTAPCRNPFKSILVRIVEVFFAFDEAIRLIDAYAPPSRPFVEVPQAAARGAGASEAPRGLLYHRYAIGADGLVSEARIIPPTSQNQRSIEMDLEKLAPDLSELPLRDATIRAEQAIRNYDPCISCSTHFLDLRIDRA